LYDYPAEELEEVGMATGEGEDLVYDACVIFEGEFGIGIEECSLASLGLR